MSTNVHLSDKLMKDAKILAKVKNRSVTEQIEYWVKIGKMAEENPDLPYNLINDLLIGLEELNSGKGGKYKFSSR